VSRHRAGLIVLIGLVVVLVLVWLLRRATEPDEPIASRAPPESAPRGHAGDRPARRPAAPAIAAPPPSSEPVELGGHDTIDPCTPVHDDAAIPAGYESVTAQDVTVAWQPVDPRAAGDNDALFQPAAIAYLIAGVLEEAAALTGTPRRDHLTVILYPSHDDFLVRNHAPAWSSGLYDGRAVRLAIAPSADLGVPVATLRHEVMHAQLHAAVGCMPAWFNEGLAMYFASRPPIGGWLRVLRGRDGFDLTTLHGPTLADLTRERADLAYAQSLAMVLFVAQAGDAGDAGLRTAVQAARAAALQGRPDADLWDRVAPGAGTQAIIEALARRMFGVPPGPALDAILDGAVCCWGTRTLRAFGCRGAPPQPDKRIWIDETRTPHAVCRISW